MRIQEAFEELKKLADGKYCSIDYIMHSYGKDIKAEDDIECRVYIEDRGSFSAPTFDLALDMLKASMKLIEPDVLEIDS